MGKGLVTRIVKRKERRRRRRRLTAAAAAQSLRRKCKHTRSGEKKRARAHIQNGPGQRQGEEEDASTQ